MRGGAAFGVGELLEEELHSLQVALLGLRGELFINLFGSRQEFGVEAPALGGPVGGFIFAGHTLRRQGVSTPTASPPIPLSVHREAGR